MLSLITHYRLCVLLLLNAVLPSREACHEAEQGKQADGGEGGHPAGQGDGQRLVTVITASPVFAGRQLRNY